MSATREVVRGKARVVRGLIKSHQLTPKATRWRGAWHNQKPPAGAWPNQKPTADSSHKKESAPSGSRQPSLKSRRVSWRVRKKCGYKRIKTHGTYHGQAQTLCKPSQLQRVAMSAPCRHDDDCCYYHSWRNNVVIAFGTLSSFLTGSWVLTGFWVLSV